MALIIEIKEHEILLIQTRHYLRAQIEVLKQFSIKLKQNTNKQGLNLMDESLNYEINKLIKVNAIKENNVNIVLNNGIAWSKELELPKTNKKQRVVLAANKLRMTFDVNSDFVVDVMHIENILKEGIQFERVMAFALPYNDITHLENWVYSLGMKIKSIQTGISSMLTVLNKSNELNNDEAQLIVDVSQTYLRFYLYYENIFLNMRTLYKQTDQKDLWTRAESFIKMANVETSSNKNTNISRVLLIGEDKACDIFQTQFSQVLDFPCQSFNLSSVLDSSINLDSKYLNALGALL